MNLRGGSLSVRSNTFFFLEIFLAPSHRHVHRPTCTWLRSRLTYLRQYMSEQQHNRSRGRLGSGSRRLQTAPLILRHFFQACLNVLIFFKSNHQTHEWSFLSWVLVERLHLTPVLIASEWLTVEKSLVKEGSKCSTSMKSCFELLVRTHTHIYTILNKLTPTHINRADSVL